MPATLPVHFALVTLKIGSCELFAHAVFEPQFSGSQPPK
jgi:hypothetical protein